MLTLNPPCKVLILKGDLETEQQRVTLPALGPASTEAELVPLPDNVLLVRLVVPGAPPRAKRYKLQNHRGSVFLSIPRYWLRDKAAVAGDLVTVHLLNDNIYLQIRKDLRDYASIIASSPRDIRGEITAESVIATLKSKHIPMVPEDPLYAA